MKDMSGRGAIVGTATAGIGEAEGISAIELAAAASRAALAEAGLAVQDVDGLFTTDIRNLYSAMELAESLGIAPRHLNCSNLGGASFVHYLTEAAEALRAGRCDVALIAYGSNQRSDAGGFSTGARPAWYEAPYAARYPAYAYALSASRYLHQYGLDRRHLAGVALSARRWAAACEEAVLRTPTTLSELLAEPVICDPFSRRDMCLVTDGAGAVVMVRSERAADSGQPPVFVLGGGTAIESRSVTTLEDITRTPAQRSGAQAFEAAGLGPDDVDLVQLYDAFTIVPLLALEDLGFLGRGEAGSAVLDGLTAPGGALPANTNGGGLCHCHPGMYGIFLVIEAVLQLRGAAGARQLDVADVALCHGVGGQFTANATAILGTAATV